MLRLCGFAGSNYCNKVKISLMEKCVPSPEEHHMVSQEPAMLERSAMGKVPFLDLGKCVRASMKPARFSPWVAGAELRQPHRPLDAHHAAEPR